MAKSCPPGVFCIENYTLIFIIILIIGVVIYFLSKTKIITHVKNGLNSNKEHSIVQMIPPFFGGGDTLLDPYLPPLKDNRYFPTPINYDVRGGVPINIQTRGFDSDYRQVGILTRVTSGGDIRETILPIMGRPLYANRNKWQFYTMSDSNNSVKLPISLEGKYCTNEYGCDDISSGDTVYVDGYNQPFKVTVYENAFPRYIPYL
jgi:hypothetical protein